MIKICKKCSKSFIPLIEKSGRLNRSVYCSKNCARPKQKLVELSCSHCKKTFQKYPSQVKANKDTVFCGNQCVIDYRKIHWTRIKDKKETKLIKLKITKELIKNCFCIICKGVFYRRPSHVLRNGDLYCSRSCYAKRTNIIEKFFKSISNVDHLNDCWIWEGKKDKDGYGVIYLDKNIRAHRYSLYLHGVNIPDHLIACHHCDTPPCVNPKHLFVGTHLDNAIDKKNKGRCNSTKGTSIRIKYD